MYHLYVKSKSTVIPKPHFTFGKLSDGLEVMPALTTSMDGAYVIRFKELLYNDVLEFLRVSDLYSHLDVYIEVSESVLKYIKFSYPNVSILGSESFWNIFTDLISKYKVHLETGGLKYLYRVLPRDYDYMNDFLLELKEKFGDNLVTIKEINSNFVIEDFTYPRTVLIEYLKMSRWRQSKLKKSIKDFGNDLVLYSMRKNVRKILEEKIKYFTSGDGPKYIKDLPYQNIILMSNALDYGRGRFKDIYLILKLYEKGITTDDFVKRNTI